MSNTASNSNPSVPRILLTTGEPAGIGPDLAVYIAGRALPAQLVFITDPGVIKDRAGLLGAELAMCEYDMTAVPSKHQPGQFTYINEPVAVPVTPGKTDSRNAWHVLNIIKSATDLCLQGTFDAMVTAPVNKAVINAAGQQFTGHTEFIALHCGVKHPVMMLMNSRLRVVLATTHLPLSAVSAALTGQGIVETLIITAAGLRQHFGIPNPVISVCGLNPHAGESGYLGHEETDVISPALMTARERGLDVRGPVPADTAFTPAALAGIDAVLTMYHDQGLPVLKSQGFGEIVNVTLGLPIIRTSVDHGTALQLAGTGKASATSMVAALDAALAMIRNG